MSKKKVYDRGKELNFHKGVKISMGWEREFDEINPMGSIDTKRIKQLIKNTLSVQKKHLMLMYQADQQQAEEIFAETLKEELKKQKKEILGEIKGMKKKAKENPMFIKEYNAKSVPLKDYNYGYEMALDQLINKLKSK